MKSSYTKLLNSFNLNETQIIKINKLINLLKKSNLSTNLVGKSTLINPMNSHILDSIQLAKMIHNKKSNIVDIGTGAGFPGIVLSIYGFINLSLVDSNSKKINFITKVSQELNLRVNIINSRIEDIINLKFDYIVSRALAKLDKLLFYSSFISHNKTKLVFLKGEKLQEEIQSAKKNWMFRFLIKNSISDKRGRVIAINNFKKKYD